MGSILNDILAMQREADRLRLEGRAIALVPTMGALHEGHLSLIRRARGMADIVITSVFVNPTQFGKGEDFTRYPRNLERDAAMAFDAGSDYVFAPEAGAMYAADHVTSVTVDRMTTVLEGKVRPTHFQGVTTVVAKLFNITRPHIAVFGQKDAQQVAVIRRMVRDLNFGIRIDVVPIVREPDGLAMSSRNVYLTPAQREEATVLHRALLLAEQRIAEGERLPATYTREMKEMITTRSTGVIDYISTADPDSLEEKEVLAPGSPALVSLAAKFGSTRLIDNIIAVPGEN